jgi:CRP/FNR family cyclic AMP-dependent transcriptional regulator
MEWPFLAAVPEEDARQLLATARRRTFARGEVVFHRGDPADTLHLIRKGRFAVRIITPLADEAILSVLSPGDFFGELALIADAPRTATVSALEPAETLSIHRLDFDRARRRSPRVGEVLMAALVDQVRRLSEHLVEALYVPVERRVVRRLHAVALSYRSDGEEILVPLTQEDIASLAGTSRGTANKVLRDLEARGIVAPGRGRTAVLDLERLGARAREFGRTDV